MLISKHYCFSPAILPQNFPPKSFYSSICAPDFLPQCFGLRIFVMAVLPQHFYKFLIFQMFQMFAPAFLVQHYCPNIFALLFLLQHFCPCLFITSILPQHFFALVFLEVSRSFGKFHEVVWSCMKFVKFNWDFVSKLPKKVWTSPTLNNVHT